MPTRRQRCLSEFLIGSIWRLGTLPRSSSSGLRFLLHLPLGPSRCRWWSMPAHPAVLLLLLPQRRGSGIRWGPAVVMLLMLCCLIIPIISAATLLMASAVVLLLLRVARRGTQFHRRLPVRVVSMAAVIHHTAHTALPIPSPSSASRNSSAPAGC